MNKVKRLLMTILTSGIATILSFLISFILTPYITNKLGVEAYGFVTLAKNFTQYATIITIALNSYAARYITVSYHNNDMEKAQEYISSVYYGDVAISAVIMIVAGGFILFLDRILNVSLELVISVKLLFLFVFLGFVLTTVGTSYTAAAYIKNRLDIVGIFRSLSYIFEVLFYVVVFAFFTPEVWQVGVAICIAQLVIFGGNYYIYKKYTHCLKIEWFTFYPTLLRTIISCTCMTISFTLIAKTLNPNTWVSFVLTAILCGVIGCIIHLVFVFSRDEKSRILVIIKSKEK